nr:protein FAR1-related sequence 5-like [Tanacetum cinerariifolium]
MVVIDEHNDHDMRESSMSHDPHDMGESSMHCDAQVDNQIVILPERLQHLDDSDEFRPTPNGTPYWVPDVPEDEKHKKGRFYDNFNDAFEMYQAFLKTHKKQPPFAVTDQDGALRNAVVKMFPDSNHRLCNKLVQFMLCFESAMKKQRYTQHVLDNASNGSTLSIFIELPFEKHVCAVSTPSIFRE